MGAVWSQHKQLVMYYWLADKSVLEHYQPERTDEWFLPITNGRKERRVQSAAVAVISSDNVASAKYEYFWRRKSEHKQITLV